MEQIRRDPPSVKGSITSSNIQLPVESSDEGSDDE